MIIKSQNRVKRFYFKLLKNLSAQILAFAFPERREELLIVLTNKKHSQILHYQSLNQFLKEPECNSLVNLKNMGWRLTLF
jgi:hypothetical protein